MCLPEVNALKTGKTFSRNREFFPGTGSSNSKKQSQQLQIKKIIGKEGRRYAGKKKKCRIRKTKEHCKK